MKTTIELPEALVADARELARLERTTLRDLVTAGLRAEIARRRAGRPARRYNFPTAGGGGLRAGVREDRLHEYAYDLPGIDE